jgi:Ca2+-binding RTX toxin-like protein
MLRQSLGGIFARQNPEVTASSRNLSCFREFLCHNRKSRQKKEVNRQETANHPSTTFLRALVMSRSSKSSSNRKSGRFQIERLETRQTMAADSGMNSGVLEIVGTDAAEIITIGDSPTFSGYYQVTIQAKTGEMLLNRSYLASRVSSIYVAALNGDDKIVNNTNRPSQLYGGWGNNEIYGGSSTDRIHGWYDSDHLYGRGGNDEIFGYGANDYLYGGEGHDWLEGGGGNDSLHGEDGDDMLYGQQNDDNLLGGSGLDFLDGGTGNDDLNGGLGDDVMFGGLGDDDLNGWYGSDWMYGDGEVETSSDGHDTLEGWDGHDLLYGMGGNDTLSGGDHNDTLNGGSGSDVLEGGNDVDIVFGGSGSDSLSGNNEYGCDRGDELYYDASDYSVDRLPALIRMFGGTAVVEGKFKGTWLYVGQ